MTYIPCPKYIFLGQLFAFYDSDLDYTGGSRGLPLSHKKYQRKNRTKNRNKMLTLFTLMQHVTKNIHTFYLNIIMSD